MRLHPGLYGLVLTACAPSLQRELAKIAPSGSAEPVSASDSIVAIVLANAELPSASPVYAPGRNVVLTGEQYTLTPRAIPARPSITFFVLDSAQIQRLADRAGDFSYVTVTAPVIGRDTARIDIKTGLAIQDFHHRTPFLVGGGNCSYIVRRTAGGWAFAARGVCVVS